MKKICKILFSFFLFAIVAQNTVKAQLVAGDIAFSGYISNTTTPGVDDGFSFVLLTNVSAGTVINFTDNGWLSTNVFRSGEETITWTSPALSAGAEITIIGSTVTRAGGGAAGSLSGTPLDLSTSGDQVLAYQGSVASPTFISAIHMNVFTTASGDATNTTAAAWDGTANSGFGSALPTGLTTGTNAIWIGTTLVLSSEKDNGVFLCSAPGVDLTTVAGVRAALNDQTKWHTNDMAAPDFTLPSGCTYLSIPAPTITTQPTASTLCAGLSVTFNVVTTGSSLSFQWQQSNDNTFASPIAINTGGLFTVNSTSTTSSLTISDNTTLNGKYYRCVVSNGGGTVNSTGVLLTATTTILPTGNPSASVTIGAGNSSFIFASSCRIIAKVVPGTISGMVDGAVWLDAAQSASYVKRHYEITPQTGASTATATVTLYFSQQDFTDFNAVNVVKLPIDATDAANNKANLRIEKRPGTSGDGTGAPASYTGTPVTITPTSVTWNSTASRWEVTFPVTGFSGFFAKAGLFILPLKLESFTGKLNPDKTVALQWKISEQQGVLEYIVEKSNNGSSYLQIGTVPAANTSSGAYAYKDNQVTSGKNYYRLKFIEQAGGFNYSKIIAVDLKPGITVVLYPSPVTDKLTVQQFGTLKATSATLVDLTGKILQTIRITSLQQEVDMVNLRAGIYLLRLNDGSSYKVIKE